MNIAANKSIVMVAGTAANRSDIPYGNSGSPLDNIIITGDNHLLFTDDTETPPFDVKHTSAGYEFAIEAEGKTYTKTYSGFPNNVELTTGNTNDGIIKLTNLSALRSHVAFVGDSLSTTLNKKMQEMPYVNVNDSIVALKEPDYTDPGIPLWLQTGANSGQGMKIEIGSVHTDHLGGNPSLSEVDVLNHENGTQALITMDAAISQVVSIRGTLGAYQNRLEYTIKSLQVSSENLAASESHIRDADMAKEMMAFTKSNILQQAAMNILAQANQSPQMILQLLR